MPSGVYRNVVLIGCFAIKLPRLRYILSGLRCNRWEREMWHVWRPIAAVPPLSQEKLNQAPVILEGKIKAIATERIEQHECIGSFKLSISIETKSTNSEEIVHGYFRKVECEYLNGRPVPHPLGDYGLRDIDGLKAGDYVRVYARPAQNGERVILSPNGLQRIK